MRMASNTSGGWGPGSPAGTTRHSSRLGSSTTATNWTSTCTTSITQPRSTRAVTRTSRCSRNGLVRAHVISGFLSNLSLLFDTLVTSAFPRSMEWGSVMDLNLIVLCGRLAVPPEIKIFESGTRLIRYLVTVRSEEPRRRVGVIPVSMWDPPEELIEETPETGRRIWVCGSVLRRFWG